MLATVREGGHTKCGWELPGMGRPYLVCCGHLIPSPCREHRAEPLFPRCSLGMPRSSLFSAFPVSQRVILVKEEEEKGNKMAFGRG